MASRSVAATVVNPYRASPAAAMALSCGQIDPLWYDIGLYRDSPAATVLMPHPANEASCIRDVATMRARSGELTMPLKRQCATLDVRTRQGRFCPSSARA